MEDKKHKHDEIHDTEEPKPVDPITTADEGTGGVTEGPGKNDPPPEGDGN